MNFALLSTLGLQNNWAYESNTKYVHLIALKNSFNFKKGALCTDG